MFNPDNNRDDDDTFHLGFEVTRERVHLSDKSRSYQPTPRSPPRSLLLREISKDKFYTAVEGPTAGESGRVLRHNTPDRHCFS